MLLGALLLAQSACYTYVPLAETAPPQGTPVRIRLQEPRSFELPSVTVRDIDQVTGEWVGDDDQDVIVSASWLTAATGQGFSGDMWTQRIRRSMIAALDVRTLSRWRTSVVLAGVLVGTYLGFDALGGTEAGSGGSGGGGWAR